MYQAGPIEPIGQTEFFRIGCGGRLHIHAPLVGCQPCRTRATLPHYSQPVMPRPFGVVALPPGHLEWAVVLPPARLVASPSHAPLYRCLWNAWLRRLFWWSLVFRHLAPRPADMLYHLQRTLPDRTGVLNMGYTIGPLSGVRVEFHSDNQAVVSSLRKGSCRCSNVMSLLRRLFLVAAKFQFICLLCRRCG